MTVLLLIIYIVLAIVAIVIGYMFLFLLWRILPLIFGVSGGVWLWKYGHDNLGIIIGISGFILFFWWNDYLDTRPIKLKDGDYGGGFSTYDKKAVYDKDGNVKGYIDKD